MKLVNIIRAGKSKPKVVLKYSIADWVAVWISCSVNFKTFLKRLRLGSGIFCIRNSASGTILSKEMMNSTHQRSDIVEKHTSVD